jgi:hypothetical protein
MDQKTEPTLDEMAYAALREQRAEVVGSLSRILDALDIDDSEDGWEDDAVELIERLRDLEDAVGEVCAKAQADPIARRYLVPADAFVAMRQLRQ